MECLSGEKDRAYYHPKLACQIEAQLVLGLTGRPANRPGQSKCCVKVPPRGVPGTGRTRGASSRQVFVSFQCRDAQCSGTGQALNDLKVEGKTL